MQKLTQKELDEFELDMLKHMLYGFNIPSDNEYEIMSMVANSLKSNFYSIEYKNFSSDEAIKSGLLSMNMFNRKYINKLKKVLFYTYNELGENDFRAMIEFKKKSGKVNEIMIPEKVNEISPIWIGHECIHCLKDTNYKEYINKDITSEVLTIFYEILSTHSIFKHLHDKWKMERLNTLIYDKYCYELAKKNLNKDDNTIIYEYIMYTYGQYLTSYYYALN